MTIIRRRDAIASATTADLVETYNALTGNSVERFSSRAVAERRVDMAIMAAEDAAAHQGLAPGAAPVAQTLQERGVQPQDGVQAQPAEPEGTVAPSGEENPFNPGTIAHALWTATRSVEANAPRPKTPPRAKGTPITPRRTELVLRATNAGISKCQPGSKRSAILAHIQSAPTVTLKELDAAFGCATRGFVQKLIEVKHVEIVG